MITAGAHLAYILRHASNAVALLSTEWVEFVPSIVTQDADKMIVKPSMCETQTVAVGTLRYSGRHKAECEFLRENLGSPQW